MQCEDVTPHLSGYKWILCYVILLQYIQWNLGNSNANFSKLPDFSKTTDGPEFFHYNLLQKYHRFFEKNQFFKQIRRSQAKKFILKSPA